MKEVKILLFSHRHFLSHESFEMEFSVQPNWSCTQRAWCTKLGSANRTPPELGSANQKPPEWVIISVWHQNLNVAVENLFLDLSTFSELFLQPIIPFPASEQSWTVFLWHKKTVKQDWLSFLKCSGQAFFSLLKEVSLCDSPGFLNYSFTALWITCKKKKKFTQLSPIDK